MYDRRNDQLADDLVNRARELGHRWGERLRAEQNQQIGRLWPGNLQDARTLVDRHMGAGMGDEERETLAMIVERGARQVWQANSGRRG